MCIYIYIYKTSRPFSLGARLGPLAAQLVCSCCGGRRASRITWTVFLCTDTGHRTRTQRSYVIICIMINLCSAEYVAIF